MKIFILIILIVTNFVFAGVEEEFHGVANYYKLNKFTLLDTFILGNSCSEIKTSLDKRKIKLDLSCSRKIRKLCSGVIGETPQLNVKQVVLVFYADTLIMGNVFIYAKGTDRVSVIKKLVDQNKLGPNEIIYKVNSIEEVAPFRNSESAFCNINNSDYPKLTKRFETLRWVHSAGKIEITSPHKIKFLDNSSTPKDCKIGFADFVAFSSSFKPTLQDEFLSLIFDFEEPETK